MRWVESSVEPRAGLLSKHKRTWRCEGTSVGYRNWPDERFSAWLGTDPGSSLRRRLVIARTDGCTYVGAQPPAEPGDGRTGARENFRTETGGKTRRFLVTKFGLVQIFFRTPSEYAAMIIWRRRVRWRIYEGALIDRWLTCIPPYSRALQFWVENQQPLEERQQKGLPRQTRNSHSHGTHQQQGRQRRSWIGTDREVHYSDGIQGSRFWARRAEDATNDTESRRVLFWRVQRTGDWEGNVPVHDMYAQRGLFCSQDSKIFTGRGTWKLYCYPGHC